MLRSFWDSLDKLYKTLQKLMPPAKIYDAAKESIGLHMTLDDTVDKSVGCAEAVCAVLQKAGVEVPAKGIPGTSGLLDWLDRNPKFEEIQSYEIGAVLVSATGTGNGKIRGHTGICAQYGILSNESQTGLWKEQWDIVSWDSYYTRYGAIPKHYFRYLG